MKIILLQDLDSRYYIAGMVVDKELGTKAKKELVKEGKAAWLDKKPPKKVKYDKKSHEIP